MTAVDMITREMDDKVTIFPTSSARSIVVATDGSETALAAFNAANLIRSRSGAEVHVLSVIEPMPLMFPAAEGMLLPPDFDQSVEEGQRAIVRDQVGKFDSAGEWTMDVRMGRPAESIVKFAHEQQADLIIVGANKHGVFGRLLGEETAMEIARLSDTPLLVASSEMTRLPKRVIIAMDLNPDGLQRAPRALETVADAPSVSCVHVKPRSDFMGIDWAQFDSEYELVMRERFKALDRALDSVHVRPDLVVLHGDPTHELIDFASYSKAELLVVGVKRRRGRARAVGGRMASRVIRQATCCVLIVPNLMPKSDMIGVPSGSTDVLSDPRLWSTALREFTAKNSGRIGTLEVDDPEIGALVEATAYPLLGADYDHKDERLTITLGYTKGADRHLTRTVVKPETISILSINGRDMALSVAHNGGQTLLTF